MWGKKVKAIDAELLQAEPSGLNSRISRGRRKVEMRRERGSALGKTTVEC